MQLKLLYLGDEPALVGFFIIHDNDRDTEEVVILMIS